jgi:uncharacterized protein YkwD
MSRFLRSLGVLLLATATLAAPAYAGQLSDADGLEAQAVAAVNEVRRAYGVRPLRHSAALSAAAEAHSREMGERGFFAHESGDGSEFWMRIGRHYPSRGYTRWNVGENLLWASPSITPARAMELWLESPGHRRVLLSPLWTEIGLAAVRVIDAPGFFGGREVMLLTADFGSRV